MKVEEDRERLDPDVFRERYGDTDIGHGVWIRFIRNETDQPIGIIDTHPNPNSVWRCSGVAMFEGSDHKGPTWHVDSLDPLTISPSLLCRACGHHGFIREGHWIPA